MAGRDRMSPSEEGPAAESFPSEAAEPRETEIGETLDEVDLYNMNYMDDEYVSFHYFI